MLPCPSTFPSYDSAVLDVSFVRGHYLSAILMYDRLSFVFMFMDANCDAVSGGFMQLLTWLKKDGLCHIFVCDLKNKLDILALHVTDFQFYDLACVYVGCPLEHDAPAPLCLYDSANTTSMVRHLRLSGERVRLQRISHLVTSEVFFQTNLILAKSMTKSMIGYLIRNWDNGECMVDYATTRDIKALSKAFTIDFYEVKTFLGVKGLVVYRGDLGHGIINVGLTDDFRRSAWGILNSKFIGLAADKTFYFDQLAGICDAVPGLSVNRDNAVIEVVFHDTSSKFDSSDFDNNVDSALVFVKSLMPTIVPSGELQADSASWSVAIKWRCGYLPVCLIERTQKSFFSTCSLVYDGKTYGGYGHGSSEAESCNRAYFFCYACLVSVVDEEELMSLVPSLRT